MKIGYRIANYEKPNVGQTTVNFSCFSEVFIFLN